MTGITAAQTATAYTAALAAVGRAMTLRRRVGTSASFTDVTVTGATRDYRPGERAAGGIAEGDIEVTIGTAETTAAAWPAPPRKGDLIVIDGRSWAVQGAETLRHAATVAAYRMQCRGG